jgi:hypothetical protein
LSTSDGPADAPAPAAGRRAGRWLCWTFVVVYLLYAINYAYFFVDDEAIPFVYAQNLLDGQGLVYNPDDGRVEGYSDFLSVGIDTTILAIVRATGADKLLALFIAKLIALACAVLLVVVTFTIVARRSGRAIVPVVAGMTFLTLAGPLAVWGWSALETTLFALIVAIVLATLLDTDGDTGRNDFIMMAAAIAAQLCRIDGFVWIAALLLPFLIAAPAARRRQLIERVVVPAAAVGVAYHAWRFWYFGELLPSPVYAKVLYKLGWRQELVSNDPPERYVLAFVKSYYWIPVAAIGLGSGVLSRQPQRQMRALAAAMLLVLGYLWAVGDWMFGFRFFVPLLAPLAILVAEAFGELTRWSARGGAVAAALWVMAIAGLGYSFEHESWWAAPSADPARMFAPFYDVYLHARPYVVPGATTAYNQAGFVPFMLGSRNIDDLGICTKFYAQLPTTDVVFTEVGRYSPLTAKPVRRASETYTVSRAPRLLLEPRANLIAANTGAVPRTVLGGTYRLLFERPAAAAYVPAAVPGSPRDPGPYLENLVHVSHLRRATLEGQVIPPADYLSTLGYLYGQRVHLTCQGRYLAVYTFSDTDEEVYELFAAAIRSSGPASIEMTLTNVAGRTVYRDAFELKSRESRELFVRLPAPVQAAALSLVIVPATPTRQSVTLEDLRVQGQTPALKRFMARYHAPLE